MPQSKDLHRFAIAAFVFSFALGAADQVRGQTTAFDVASVKKSSAATGILYHLPAGRFKASGFTLLNLIAFAYDIPEDRIQGSPAWGSRDRFDIEATADGPVEQDPAKMETPVKKTMVQQLLAERFQLETSVGRRATATYALVRLPGSDKLVRNTDKPYLIRHARKRSYTSQRATMAALAKQLSNEVRSDVGKPVIDKTGIEGEFDFTLSWSGIQPTNIASVNGPSQPQISSAKDDLPSIFEALQQQLGLQLKADHELLPVMEIVKVQLPTAN